MSDKEFRKILGEILMKEYRQTLDDADDSHIFSESFENKMKNLINLRKKPYYKMINSYGKRVACVAVAITIIVSTTILSVSSLRKPIFNFFIQKFSNYSNISTEPKEHSKHPNEIKDRYEITYDISNYSIIYTISNTEEYTMHYQTGNEYIYYTQHIIDGFNVNYNTEDAIIEDLQINGYDAFGYLDNHGWYTIIWNDGEYMFSIGSNISKDVLIQIAKSVKKVE
ncbi:MAG: DUF4367 domain-containing protein [Lachnospiraceae bacterium]|nr:DUF4367 domain-containing protein [Lachnospiraceae bacterium]